MLMIIDYFSLNLLCLIIILIIMDKIVPNPAATIVNYIKNKCNLPPDQI